MAKQTGVLTIDASPTKELFIDMLTRDVALIPAILDLADNCVDGARRVAPSAESWKGYELAITLDSNTFHIKDTCGGIPVEVARQYAFRFGRPSDAKSIKGEVGRFGLGMKRGLFKLGRHFKISSTTQTSHFDVTIDVDQWAHSPRWEFQFDDVPQNRRYAKTEQGTAITVTRLRQHVSEQFADGQFVQQLRADLTAALEDALLGGFSARVNQVSLKAHDRTLLADKGLAPAGKDFTLRGPTGGEVYVSLVCGLGRVDSKKHARVQAGWYVFCNGRMLLEADKTPATGWGETEDQSMPAFHAQYNDFRGFAHLEADESADLPWNTTKTGLDVDHPIYRHVLQQMIAISRPVITYLNRRKQEKEELTKRGDDSVGPLEQLFLDANLKTLADVPKRERFTLPKPPPLRLVGPTMQNINFKVELAKASRARKRLHASTWADVGKRVFDYYYRSECES